MEAAITEQDVWKALGEVFDPEIPALSLIDMKIIRTVHLESNSAVVKITPTFVGCPALDQIKSDIRKRLEQLGLKDVRIETEFSLPWSTDLLGSEAREKLRAFGIAPPPVKAETLAATLELAVACPFCGSEKTRLESRFGSTLCKQLFYCDDCRESFERFKPL